MEILGIGPSELIFIVLIALILLGPKDMVAAGRTFGKTLRKIVTSPTWKAVRTTGQELQQLPTRLMREAGLDEELQDLNQEVRDAAESIDPRRMMPPPTPPAPAYPVHSGASPFEADSLPGPNPGAPGAESPPENPQV